jgi:hypothetical protein
LRPRTSTASTAIDQIEAEHVRQTMRLIDAALPAHPRRTWRRGARAIIGAHLQPCAEGNAALWSPRSGTSGRADWAAGADRAGG